MGVCIWCWYKNPIIPIEASRRVKTEKSMSSWVKYEGFAHCFEVLHRLRKAIRQKRTELWENPSLIFHHDTAPAHISIFVLEFLAKNETVIMPQPPSSPDLAPAECFLFPKLDTPMNRKRFATIGEIKDKSEQEPLAITKSAFQRCFEVWKKGCNKCIENLRGLLWRGQYSYW